MPARVQSSYIAPPVDEIIRDPITDISRKYWALNDSNKEQLDTEVQNSLNQIIKNIYDKYIKGYNFSRRKLMILEFTRYLENYLWKHFTTTTKSFEHILSIVCLINEKARGKIQPFQCLEDNIDKVDHLFMSIYDLINDYNSENSQKLSYREHCQCVEFFINCINNIELSVIRNQFIQIVGISIWACLLPVRLIFTLNRLEYELSANNTYKKLYRKNNDKLKKLPANIQNEYFFLKISAVKKSHFVSNYIKFYLTTLESIKTEDFDNEDFNSKLYFIHFFTYLLIELESLLYTRRFFHVLSDDHHIMVRTRSSYLWESGKDSLFVQLWEILKFYLKIEIDETRGVELNPNQLLERHYNELTRLQRIAFIEFKSDMQQFYLDPVYRIDSRDSLADHFSKLNDDNLNKFAHHCNIVNYLPGKQINRDYLIELLTFKYEKTKTLMEKVNLQPIYPDEQMLWYDSKLPYDDWSGEDCLPLPKLNLQFLTLNDYLWRNFTLFLLESTYGIKNDIEDAITRLKPWMNELGDTQFAGWARMAQPLKDFAIHSVGSTDVSTSNPKHVYADLTISTRMREAFKKEWLDLRKYDPVFLLQIHFDIIGAVMHQDEFFPRKYGIISVRGAEIIGLLNDDGKVIDEGVEYKHKGNTCSYRIALDPNQYQKDIDAGENGDSVYNHLNVILRRKPKENNFKAVLETIRMLMNTECLIPDWLGDVFLGYGDPTSAHPTNVPQDHEYIDFFDTFVDSQHVISSFPDYKVTITSDNHPYWRLYFKDKCIKAETYTKELSLFDQQKEVKVNKLPYTVKQVEAITNGLRNGLTLIVGPPGTGKTDVAVQIISSIFNVYPEQRTLIVTHSNQALNHIFEKIINLNVDELKIIRLGHGEEEMDTNKDFSRRGRVNQILARRLELIQKVIDLQKSMNIEGMFQHTCETAANFFTYQIKPRIIKFLNTVNNSNKSIETIFAEFPFTTFMNTVVSGEIFPAKTFEENYEKALEYIDYVEQTFKELISYRPFELLRIVKDRSNYMVSKTCKIIAMTCVHAALKRRDLVDLKFQYDNIIMEESAQILEIETFIPLLLQNPYEGSNRLKRIILIGDHNQLPPIIRNPAFQKYCNMEQSLFTRLIRLSFPYVELDQQGRCRPSICELFDWRYHNLKTLPLLVEKKEYQHANTGLLFEYQLINVEDFNGVGESEPTRHFIQNLGEAEYAVSLYIYMRINGYPAEKISILTTYNGQKNLIRDILKKKCSQNPLIGEPKHVSTVDRFQGQQNDYIILSLVRTKTIGHLRDIRRLIVAMSRARLGLYIFARVSLFSSCHELVPTMNKLLKFPTSLHIVLNDSWPTSRPQNSFGMVPANSVRSFESLVDFTDFLQKLYASFAYHHQLEENKLEQEQKKIEAERKEYKAHLKEMELIAEANSRKYEGLIQNEIEGEPEDE